MPYPRCNDAISSKKASVFYRLIICVFLYCLEAEIITQLLREYKGSLNHDNDNAEQNTKQKTAPKKQVLNIWRREGKKGKTPHKIDIQAILKKSVITPEFEKMHSVPAYEVSEKKMREMRKVNKRTVKKRFVILFSFTNRKKERKPKVVNGLDFLPLK